MKYWLLNADTAADEQYWTQGYTPTAEDITSAAPAFLRGVAKDIFLCGKSFSLLRLCTSGQVYELSHSLDGVTLKKYSG